MMSIQGIGHIAMTSYVANMAAGKAGHAAPASEASAPRPAGPASGSETQVTLSDQAMALARADAQEDVRLAEIKAKDPAMRTADEIDHLQKSGGLVNTMSQLTPDEKRLYDELVAQGNTEAVQGLNLLALSRMGGNEVTLPDGRSFDPKATELTPDNIRQLFSRMFVDNDGQSARSFEALTAHLERTPGAARQG